MSRPDVRRGSLVIVGSGIRIVGQLTVEAIACIKDAELVLHLVSDPIAEVVLESLNPGHCESLVGFYAQGKPRIDTYHEMVGRILEGVRSGIKVCVVTYGHPGVFAYPTHEAVRRARAEGFEARMIAGISAEDCLFADLGFDPASTGCLTFEATDFLIHNRRVDPTCLVILWQISVVGVEDRPTIEPQVFALPLLVERLSETYPADHPVIIYQATIVPGQRPFVSTVPLCDLADSDVPGMARLCIPPAVPLILDQEMANRLNRLQTEAMGALPL